MELDEARAPFDDRPNREILAAIRSWAQANGIDDAWLTDEYDYNERPRLELAG